MAVNTKFNVKVPLEPDSTPGEDKIVYWDESSGSFELTGSFGGISGITVDSRSVEIISSADTLDFYGAVVTETPSGTAKVVTDLQSVTTQGFETNNQGMFHSSQSLNFGNQTGIRADSGFRVKDNVEAYTHVTPRRSVGKQTFLSIPANASNSPQAYSNNYITFTNLTLDPGTSGTSGGGESTPFCTEKWNMVSPASPPFLSLGIVQIGHTVSITVSPSFDPPGNINDPVTIYDQNAPGASVQAVIQSVVTQGTNTVITFQITAAPVLFQGYTSGNGNDPLPHCYFLNEVNVLSITFGGEGGGGTSGDLLGTAQIFLTNNSSSDDSPRGGTLISSTGNIYFFKPDVSASLKGVIQPFSASAQIGLAQDNSIKFSIGTGTPYTGSKEILFISRSGNEPRVGIGFTGTDEEKATQFTAFEVKTAKDSTDGTEFFLRSSRTDRGANVGDTAGAIYFLIDSGSYNTGSKSEFIQTASIASIDAVVTEVSVDGVQGHLRINTARSNTDATRALWTMGYGADPQVGGNFGSITTGSLNIVRPNSSIDDMLTLTNYNGDYISLMYYSSSFTTNALTTVDSFLTGSYTGVIYDYTLSRISTGARIGQIMAVWDDVGRVEITEVSTRALGSGGIPTFTSEISGTPSQFVLQIATGSGYTFKSFVKRI